MSRLHILASLISVSILTGCASPDSVSIRSEQAQNCAQVERLLEKPATASPPALEEIALNQNAEVLLRRARIEHYQSIDRLLSHLQLNAHPYGGIPVSLSGMLKLLTDIFKRGNPANDAELRELRLLLTKTREQVIKNLSDSLHELQAEKERLVEAQEQKRKAYAAKLAANIIAKVVPLPAPQETADKAQRAHVKAEDSVRGKVLRIGTLRTELLQLTGCLKQQTASQK